MIYLFSIFDFSLFFVIKIKVAPTLGEGEEGGGVRVWILGSVICVLKIYDFVKVRRGFSKG